MNLFRRSLGAFAALLSIGPALALQQGTPNANGIGALSIANALSELVTAGSQAAARANLGLGTAATLPVGPGGVAPYSLALSVTPNRPALAPSTTSLSATVATVYPVGSYVSVRVRLLTPGHQVACTGDGSSPVIGSSTTATATGQDIFWPIQTGGAMPFGPFQCVGSGAVTIAAEAH